MLAGPGSGVLRNAGILREDLTTRTHTVEDPALYASSLALEKTATHVLRWPSALSRKEPPRRTQPKASSQGAQELSTWGCGHVSQGQHSL